MKMVLEKSGLRAELRQFPWLRTMAKAMEKCAQKFSGSLTPTVLSAWSVSLLQHGCMQGGITQSGKIGFIQGENIRV
jgi:hypothetical protein